MSPFHFYLIISLILIFKFRRVDLGKPLCLILSLFICFFRCYLLSIHTTSRLFVLLSESYSRTTSIWVQVRVCQGSVQNPGPSLSVTTSRICYTEYMPVVVFIHQISDLLPNCHRGHLTDHPQAPSLYNFKYVYVQAIYRQYHSSITRPSRSRLASFIVVTRMASAFRRSLAWQT